MKRLLAIATLVLGNIVWFYAMKYYSDMRQVRVVSATSKSVVELASIGPLISRIPWVNKKDEVGYHYAKTGFGRLWMGTGVFVSNDGLIITCAHLVTGAKLMEVNLDGFDTKPTLIRGFPRKKLFAYVVGVDEKHDIALLRVINPGQHFRPVELRNEVQKGLPVLTIGFPNRFVKHASAGIVSSFDKTYTYTDVAIEHGSSGGGLFDADGRLVGLASFLYYMEDTEVFQGVSGFTDLKAMHKLMEKYERF